jgi:RNA polymerase sigma-70 factor (ECF subfamily)
MRPAVSRASVPTDTELVARCRRGDHAAWRMLHDRHAPTVYRFLSALGVPSEEREDACQDVFVAVYRSLDRFRGAARLSTWIYRIAARGAGRAMRRRRMHGLLATLLLREPPPPPDPDPSERSARLATLDTMLQKLSPKKRLVLVLFEIEELPVDEIARIAGCPENTVWSRLHHARSELTAMARKSASRSP